MKCPHWKLPGWIYKCGKENHERLTCKPAEGKEVSETQYQNIVRLFCDGNYEQCNFYKAYKKEENNNMENNITAAQTLELTEKQLTAQQLHNQISTDIRFTQHYLVQMAKGLKRMRDEKLYKELGHESFEDYVENNGAYSFKPRQAYTYIRAIESLGERFIEANSEIGITKLDLLTKLPAFERDEFAAENDLAGMTVSEIEQLIKDKQNQGEQISLLEDEVKEKSDSVEALREQLKRDKELHERKEQELKEQLEKLERLNADLKQQPVTVHETPSLSDEEIEKIRQDAEQKARNQFLAEAQKEADRADRAEKEKSKLADRVSELEEKLNKAESEKIKVPEVDEIKAQFKFYFKNIQETLQKFCEALNSLSPEDNAKYTAGFLKYLDMLKGQLGGDEK